MLWLPVALIGIAEAARLSLGSLQGQVKSLDVEIVKAAITRALPIP
jgi:hypothetical protein